MKSADHFSCYCNNYECRENLSANYSFRFNTKKTKFYFPLIFETLLESKIVFPSENPLFGFFKIAFCVFDIFWQQKGRKYPTLRKLQRTIELQNIRKIVKA